MSKPKVSIVGGSAFYGRSIVEQMLEVQQMMDDAPVPDPAFIYIDGDVVRVSDGSIVIFDDGSEGKATANHVDTDILNKICNMEIRTIEIVRYIESPPLPIEIVEPNKPWYRQGEKSW